ncbi:hypothetical protein [Sorangium sp. So ce1024]|uniref:hypothetical protein n=1 Tax=Sorangium sp. So ce1024 TaxID=3133327 RepID=UPI003F10D163
MGNVVHLVDPRLRVADKLAGALAACLEGARGELPRDADRRCVVAQALADLIREHDLERDVLTEIMPPEQFHAWESLVAALNAWPGPGPTVARGWKRLALATTDEEREAAVEELRRHGIEPPAPRR